MESVNLEGKTVVITGANTGIGKTTAREIARTGARVILACRSETKAEEARTDIVAQTGNENVEVRKLDLASLQSVRDFAKKFNQEEARLDILICNAGLITQDRIVTEDGYEHMFAVNHLAHFLLTNLLLDKLKASAPSRVVVVSSKGHEKNPVNFDDLQSENFENHKVYGRSKSCNILFAVQLAKKLKGTKVTTYALHPGLILTDFGRDLNMMKCCCKCCVFCLFSCFLCIPLIGPEKGAQTTLYCSLEPSIAEDSGKYYSDSKEKAAKPHATNPESAEKLWNISMELCGLK